MWTRLGPSAPSAFPTPLPTGNVGRRSVREQLLDNDEDDARPPPPKKRAHYSIRPIFGKYKRRENTGDDTSAGPHRNQRPHRATNPSSAPDSPMIEDLKRRYAELRVTLHSNGMKDFAKTEEELMAEAEEEISANLTKLNKVASKERQLSATCLDCEVDTLITGKDGQQRTHTVQVRKELLRHQEIEAERSRHLARLWSSWESTQADISELSNKLHELFEHGPPKGTNGMSPNCEWADKEDLDIDRRSKQVVEDMVACEEEFQEKLKDEEANVIEAMLSFSLG